MPDPTLFVGERVVVEDAASPPARSRVERIVYLGDEVLYRESWYTGYRSEKKIVRVGTKPRPVTPPPTPPEDETSRRTTTRPAPAVAAAAAGRR